MAVCGVLVSGVGCWCLQQSYPQQWQQVLPLLLHVALFPLWGGGRKTLWSVLLEPRDLLVHALHVGSQAVQDLSLALASLLCLSMGHC